MDAFCVLPSHLAPAFRIAVEAKDWARPLTREQCSQIIADYHSIVDEGTADQFLLVTRNGIVPNARFLFDGRRFQHLTFTQLADKVFDPTPLKLRHD